jgi:hypothetical protein
MLENIETLQRDIDRMVDEFMMSNRQAGVVVTYDWERVGNSSVFGTLTFHEDELRRYFW